MLDFSCSRQGFDSEQHPHLASRLNPFLSECHEKIRRLVLDIVTKRTPEPEEHFGEEDTGSIAWIGRRKKRRPIVYMSVEEICDTHR